MAAMRPDRRLRFTVVALVVICVGLLVLDSQGRTFPGVRRVADRAFSPVERGAHSIADPVGTFFSGLPDVGSHQRQLDALHRENDQLRSQLRSNSLDASRSEALTKLGLLTGRDHLRVATASVIDLGPSLGFEWAVRIDAGTAQGVREGMTVINANGLVGRVKRASASTSVVVLAADPGSSAGVRIIRSGELGLASGAGLGQLRFTPLDPEAKVRVGDTVVTGPYGASTYTAGVPVGRVSSVSGGRARIEPYVDYSALDVLAVVLSAGRPSSRTPASTAPSSTSPSAGPSSDAARAGR